jgi:predicted dehydrogenase
MGFNHFNGYLDHPDVEVVAVADRREDRRNHVKKTCEENNIKIYHEGIELIRNEPLDILSVAVPNNQHKELTIAGLEAGTHILCDKPLCTSLNELAEIRQLCQEKDLKVGIMLDLRDSPGICAAKELIDSGAAGEIRSMSFGGQHPLNYGTRPGWYFEAGKHGGTINDIAIHGLDAIEYLTGHRISGLHAARCWNSFAEKEPHFKDSAQLMFSLDNGASCIADVSYSSPDKFGFTLPLNWRFTFWCKNGVMDFCESQKQLVFYDNISGEKRVWEAQGSAHSDYLEIFWAELNGISETFGTAHLLNITQTALELQQLADN